MLESSYRNWKVSNVMRSRFDLMLDEVASPTSSFPNDLSSLRLEPSPSSYRSYGAIPILCTSCCPMEGADTTPLPKFHANSQSSLANCAHLRRLFTVFLLHKMNHERPVEWDLRRLYPGV